MKSKSTKEVIHKLQKAEWKKVRQHGSHAIYKKDGKITVVKVTAKEIPLGTLRSIQRQTGVKF